MTCEYEAQRLWESFHWPQLCAHFLVPSLVCKLVSIQHLKWKKNIPFERSALKQILAMDDSRCNY